MTSVEPDLLKQVMRQWTAGVCIVTTRLGIAIHGCTANSFTSVSITPPLVALSLARTGQTYSMLRESGIFAVSILSDEQQDLASRFASSLYAAQERFSDEPFHNENTGAPVLDRALAFVDCRLHAEVEAGPNAVLLGTVVGGGVLQSGRPLVYHNRQYWKLSK